MSERLLYTENPRSPHLYRIWNQLRASSDLPQVDRWLAQLFRGEKRFGKKDRQWYADAIFAALRYGPLLLAAESSLLAGNTEFQGDWHALRALVPERIFFWLSLLQAETADAWLREKEQLQQLQGSEGLFRWGIPAFYAPMLQRRRQLSHWSEADAGVFLARQLQKAPLWLRLNHPGQADSVRRELHEQGISWNEQGMSWQIKTDRRLQTLRCMEEGWLEIQDLASQEIGAAMNLKSPALVWDCCAGGGGKTLQIAATLPPGGLVFASDVRSYKLEEVERRAGRAGLRNVRTLTWDGERLPASPAAWQKNAGVDGILIDAPCTGTGTWRRSPDAKYRCDAASLQALQQLQSSLFAKVLPVLKKQGQLVYATCSWLPEENEDVVAAALAAHPELRLERQQLCGNPTADADTMFYAVFRKES